MPRPTPEDIRALASGEPPAAEFQRRWQAGQKPQIESFVSQQATISVSDLAAVVRVDLRHRWRSGERAATSDYVSRFPQLLADSAVVFDLLYTEFLVREELGERSHLALLQQQFPEHAAELAAQVEFHCALENEAPEHTTYTPPTQKTIPPGPRPRTRLPTLGTGYEVLGEIGRGGMGIVYRARQVGLNRLVALKMVRGADFASDELLARFRAEAEAVARLHHPNIVQIFDYGEHDGLPYLALELVEGQTLAAQIDGQPWPERKAAALIASLAVAVQFAHERGVIHRDLKPANILVESRNEASESSAPGLQSSSRWPQTDTAKITDFGLAKVFHDDAEAQTQTGSVLGTPSYMAPEQASGQGALVGPQTDVYALGAILYELLAGRPAFRGPTAIATLQQVQRDQHVPLRRLNPRVPRDLVTICDKCLSKDPSRRYASAGALASDLERFLNDRPIAARRTSALERGWRWCRRNPALATLGTSVAVLLFAVAIVSSISSVRLGAELKKREHAESAEREAKQTAQLRLWDAYLAEASARTVSHQLGHRFATLETVDRASALLDQIGRTPERERQLRNAAIAALVLPDLRQLRRIEGPSSSLQAYSVSAKRHVIVLAGGDISVRDLEGHELLRLAHRGLCTPSISRDGRYLGITDGRDAKVWRINGTEKTDGAEIVTAEVAWEETGASRLSLAPDCQHAAVAGADGAMQWINLESGKTERQLGRGEAQSSFNFHESSRRIAVYTGKGVQIISWETGAVLNELPVKSAIAEVAWHPAGEHVVVSGVDEGVALLHIASKRQVQAFPHFGVLHFSFVGRGDYLLTHNFWDSHLSLWHTATGHQVLSDPTFGTFSVEQMPDGRNLLFVNDYTEATLWEIDTAPACSALPHLLESTLGWRLSVAISPDGRILMLGGAHGLELWDLERQQLAGRLEGGLAFATFLDDGSIVARFPSEICHWPRREVTASSDSITHEIVFGPPQKLFGPTVEPKFAISPDGKMLLARGREGWRASGSAAPEVTLATAPLFDPRTAAVTTDAKWVAVGSWTGHGVSIFSPHSGEHVAQVETGLHCWPIFSPNNRLMATTPDGVRVWNTVDWQRVSEVRARGGTASDLGIMFSPDSSVLAVSQPTGTTRLVDPLTGVDWAVLTHPDQIAGSYIRFSPDQRWLITTSAYEHHRAVRIWDLTAIRRELATRGLDWPADVLAAKDNANSLAAKTPLSIRFELGSHLKNDKAMGVLRDVGDASAEILRRLLGGDSD